MRNLDRTVLIGTSLDLESDEVVRVGLDIARRLGARPILAHAFSSPAVAPMPVGPVDTEGIWLGAHRQALQARLDRQCREMGAPREAVQRLELGSPFELLKGLAEVARVDLVVVGACRAEQSHPLGLGSTSERLARLCPAPLLVVRSGAFHPPRDVVFPVDCSEISGGGLRFGLELLEALGVDRAAARALFVLHPLADENGGAFSGEQIERFAAGDVAEFVRRFAGSPLPVQVRTGRARQAIVEELSESRADLAVLPTRGRSGLERLFLGSVTAGVVHDAPSNVLVIPAAIAEAESRRAGLEALAC